ncbi:lecithin retinol acyltransferase family protein [Helicobacter mehlei]|uniref:lecithin retinol acyltransferase family protein n=1 Tax=Helicobacter mehlei TaxID=2316080 RepID=UPI000EAD702F|nr:lecithin retinol acyltransferase family protein [Helicobacter mehlei]
MATDLDKKFKKGSVVQCDMGAVEHSGIYVGNNEFVELCSDGVIKKVGIKEFITPLSDQKEGKFLLKGRIRAFCKRDSDGDWVAVGDQDVCKRALDKVDDTRDYNLLFDNCHQFTAGCMSGDFENAINFLWMLKDEAKNYFKVSDGDWAGVDVEA